MTDEIKGRKQKQSQQLDSLQIEEKRTDYRVFALFFQSNVIVSLHSIRPGEKGRGTDITDDIEKVASQAYACATFLTSCTEGSKLLHIVSPIF